jgi:hypothetical protein
MFFLDSKPEPIQSTVSVWAYCVRLIDEHVMLRSIHVKGEISKHPNWSPALAVSSLDSEGIHESVTSHHDSLNGAPTKSQSGFALSEAIGCCLRERLSSFRHTNAIAGHRTERFHGTTQQAKKENKDATWSTTVFGWR